MKHLPKQIVLAVLRTIIETDSYEIVWTAYENVEFAQL